MLSEASSRSLALPSISCHFNSIVIHTFDYCLLLRSAIIEQYLQVLGKFILDFGGYHFVLDWLLYRTLNCKVISCLALGGLQLDLCKVIEQWSQSELCS